MNRDFPFSLSSDQALVVRPILREEKARWCQWMRQHHYLGFERIVGESLCYVASRGADWVVLLGWGSAALKCGPRDQWIGWDRTLQWRRLHLIANNVRFLILPDWHEPNLASGLLSGAGGGTLKCTKKYYGIKCHPILCPDLKIRQMI